MGIFAPFGLGQEYNNSNNDSIFRNQISKIDLKTIVVNPTIAFKVNDMLSVGAGIDYMWGQAKLAKTPWAPQYGGNLYNLDMKADGDAWGYNFGVLLKATENLKIGANYRSAFTLKLKDGDVNIANINTTGVPALGGGSVSQVLFGGATNLQHEGERDRLPARDLRPGSVVHDGQVDVERGRRLDVLAQLHQSSDHLPESSHRSLRDSNAPKNWKDVCALRFGAEYRVTDPLSLRAGFVYDPTPGACGHDGAGASRTRTGMNYMAGAGYKIGPWTIDGAVHVHRQEGPHGQQPEQRDVDRLQRQMVRARELLACESRRRVQLLDPV